MDPVVLFLLAFIAGSIATILGDRYMHAYRARQYERDQEYRFKVIAEYEAERAPVWP